MNKYVTRQSTYTEHDYRPEQLRVKYPATPYTTQDLALIANKMMKT
jgi:hypothetical protein